MKDDDLVRRKDVELALLEKGQRSRRYKLSEIWELDFTEIREALADVPSAQPIIHCEACKWFQCNMRQDGYLPKGVDEFECRHWCGSCDPVDFCSHAERREE